ncbi:MAG: primosomal protein N' [Prevotellaceae bacterium]|jgi:primosomal protein N' (replication factor Y)|nr:primosomal protein N' [Prevotellaceae bacterium]
MLLAEIILPLPLAQTYTYIVPMELVPSIAVGHRVIVSFGTKKFYIGIVLKLLEGTAEKNYKSITEIIDNEPVILENQLKFWQILSEYYCASLGGVYAAAVPSGLRLKNKAHKEKKAISCFPAKISVQEANTLTEQQQSVFNEINEIFKQKSTVLLHGVTSSGKTEIYIQLINNALKKKKQVLFLVPEIGLTSQLMERLQKIFGEKLLIYHSKISDVQRVKVWQILLQSSENKVVIGTRSSIFLPFRNLNLIVIDEEQDASYKQADAFPHYNARNAAAFLAKIFGAKILLGSATPSVESYSNAQFGKYGLVTLEKRFNDIKLPEIQLVDIKESYRKKRMKGHFSLELIDKITQTLAKGEQVILFQNRRGFSLSLECGECGWVQKCKQCDVSLEYHRLTNILSCHYCGYTTNNQRVCKNCGSVNLTNRGFGTEQAQAEAEQLFPDYKVARLDSDSAKKRNSFSEIIADFESKKNDILVGTQIVSKGIDFSNVGLAAVLNADNLMNFPDFRAHENAFQTLVQISGRAGRKEGQGSVVIQTFSPESLLLKDVCNNDFAHFFKTQMAERYLFNYPPYCRLIKISLKNKDKNFVKCAADKLAEILRKENDFIVLGPDNPPVEKVQLMFLRDILLKIPNSISYKDINKKICNSIQTFRQETDYKYVMISIFVDTV